MLETVQQTAPVLADLPVLQRPVKHNVQMPVKATVVQIVRLNVKVDVPVPVALSVIMFVVKTVLPIAAQDALLFVQPLVLGPAELIVLENVTMDVQIIVVRAVITNVPIPVQEPAEVVPELVQE